MERVISQQIHSKKIMEKDLGEIETKQRIIEAKRLKQIRDLGVDLAKLQRTTRDLDEFIDDLMPKGQERRGSMPALNSSGSLSYFLEESRSPRSKRRLSAIATLPAHKQELNEFSRNDTDRNRAENRYPENQRRGSNSATLCQGRGSHAESGATSSSSKFTSLQNTSGRASGRHTSTSASCEADIRHQNKTALCAHQEDESSASSDWDSSYSRRRHQGRRASEPTLGGCFIRGLQDSFFSDLPPLDIAEAEEVKKSIQKNLPSNIVAEIDEEDEEVSKSDTATSDTRNNDRLSSILESDQDANDGSIGSKSDRSQEKSQSSRGRGNSSMFSNAVRQRRKSDGDVLKFSKTWKVRAEDNPGRDRQNDYLQGDTDNPSGQDEPRKSVRTSRHIEGHAPPEMTEPQDN